MLSRMYRLARTILRTLLSKRFYARTVTALLLVAMVLPMVPVKVEAQVQTDGMYKSEQCVAQANDYYDFENGVYVPPQMGWTQELVCEYSGLRPDTNKVGSRCMYSEYWDDGSVGGIHNGKGRWVPKTSCGATFRNEAPADQGPVGAPCTVYGANLYDEGEGWHTGYWNQPKECKPIDPSQEHLYPPSTMMEMVLYDYMLFIQPRTADVVARVLQEIENLNPNDTLYTPWVFESAWLKQISPGPNRGAWSGNEDPSDQLFKVADWTPQTYDEEVMAHWQKSAEGVAWFNAGHELWNQSQKSSSSWFGDLMFIGSMALMMMGIPAPAMGFAPSLSFSAGLATAQQVMSAVSVINDVATGNIGLGTILSAGTAGGVQIPADSVLTQIKDTAKTVSFVMGVKDMLENGVTPQGLSNIAGGVMGFMGSSASPDDIIAQTFDNEGSALREMQLANDRDREEQEYQMGGGTQSIPVNDRGTVGVIPLEGDGDVSGSPAQTMPPANPQDIAQGGDVDPSTVEPIGDGTDPLQVAVDAASGDASAYDDSNSINSYFKSSLETGYAAKVLSPAFKSVLTKYQMDDGSASGGDNSFYVLDTGDINSVQTRQFLDRYQLRDGTATGGDNSFYGINEIDPNRYNPNRVTNGMRDQFASINPDSNDAGIPDMATAGVNDMPVSPIEYVGSFAGGSERYTIEAINQFLEKHYYTQVTTMPGYSAQSDSVYIDTYTGDSYMVTTSSDNKVIGTYKLVIDTNGTTRITAESLVGGDDKTLTSTDSGVVHERIVAAQATIATPATSNPQQTTPQLPPTDTTNPTELLIKNLGNIPSDQIGPFFELILADSYTPYSDQATPLNSEGGGSSNSAQAGTAQTTANSSGVSADDWRNGPADLGAVRAGETKIGYFGRSKVYKEIHPWTLPDGNTLIMAYDRTGGSNPDVFGIYKTTSPGGNRLETIYEATETAVGGPSAVTLFFEHVSLLGRAFQSSLQPAVTTEGDTTGSTQQQDTQSTQPSVSSEVGNKIESTIGSFQEILSNVAQKITTALTSGPNAVPTTVTSIPMTETVEVRYGKYGPYDAQQTFVNGRIESATVLNSNGTPLYTVTADQKIIFNGDDIYIPLTPEEWASQQKLLTPLQPTELSANMRDVVYAVTNTPVGIAIAATVGVAVAAGASSGAAVANAVTTVANAVSDTITAIFTNSPTANAGDDITITLPTSTASPINASAVDSDNDIVSIEWNVISAQNESTVTVREQIENITKMSEGTIPPDLFFDADYDGVITSDDVRSFRLQASTNLDSLYSRRAVHVLRMSVLNRGEFYPEYDANGDGRITSGDAVAFLRQDQISLPRIENYTTINPTFIFNNLTEEGTYTIRLEVTDATGNTASDDMQITVVAEDEGETSSETDENENGQGNPPEEGETTNPLESNPECSNGIDDDEDGDIDGEDAQCTNSEDNNESPAPSGNLTASSYSIRSGQTASLTWESHEAENCEVQGDPTLPAWKESSDTVVTSALTADTTYILTCDEGHLDSVTIEVETYDEISLTASHEYVVQGDDVVLEYNTIENSCTLSGGSIRPTLSIPEATNGTRELRTPVRATATYRLACPSGEARTVRVEILPLGFQSR